jgi:hypothetical protein
MKNEFIEGKPDDVLRNVDSRIFSQIILNLQKPVFGQGLYLLSRIDNTINSMNDKLEQQISNLLNYCCSQFKIENMNYSLCYLNSVLYFLLHIDRLGFDKKYKQLAQLRKISPDIVKKTLDRKSFDDNDLFVFDKILDSIGYRQRKKWRDVLQIKNYVNVKSDSKKQTVEKFINCTWLNTLYFNDNQNKIELPPEEDIYNLLKKSKKV